MDSLIIHHAREPHPDMRVPDPHQDTFSKNVLGFWVYLMSDCLLFASLFTTFAVLHNETFGGPTSKEVFHLSTAFIETMILLCSSVTCGFGVLSSLKNKTYHVIGWFAVTFLLGASFIAMELHEFTGMVLAGHSWRESAFLSSYFTLVGTHGLHVSFGLLWLFVVTMQVLVRGVIPITFRRIVIFSLFWHFLDVVWIFIFTFVYLMGVSYA
jgi:cytochrome o ubiquinol oxidase subunit III